MRWVGELARRKVLKVGAVYMAAAWVLLQLTDVVAPALELPAWTLKFVLLLLVLGFPLAIVLAWPIQPHCTGPTGRERRPRSGAAYAHAGLGAAGHDRGAGHRRRRRRATHAGFGRG